MANRDVRKLTLVSASYRGQRIQEFVPLPVTPQGRPFIARHHLMKLFQANGITVLPNTTYSYGS